MKYLLVLIICSLLPSSSSAAYIENDEDQCRDKIDNDGDGAIDCADSDCRKMFTLEAEIIKVSR